MASARDSAKKKKRQCQRQSRRQDYFPEAFLQALVRAVPALNAESREIQAGLAFLVWVEGTKRRQHKDLDGYMSIPYQELHARFGREGFKGINQRLAIFNVTPNWSLNRNATKGYLLTDVVAEIKQRFLHKSQPRLSALVAMDGKRLLSLPKAVASKDMDGVTAKAWAHAKPINRVRVDLPQLKSLYAQLIRLRDDTRLRRGTGDMFVDAEVEPIEYRCDILAQLMRLAHTTVAGEGYVMHRYVEASTGRLYACGINLQTVPRLIKQTALHGLWEYDFENCHYAIFYQMAVGAGYQCDRIAEYLANKHAIRARIASANGLTIGQAKMCLLAAMYGARPSARLENAIPEAIGVEAAKRLYVDPDFSGILGDIQRGRKIILEKWPKRRTTLLNAVGKRIQKTARPEQILAHLIQGVEVHLLQAVLALHPKSIVLIQHDGFASSDRLDVRVLERAMLDATGYTMYVSEAQIAPPPNLAFED